jgi:hypothetical protein
MKQNSIMELNERESQDSFTEDDTPDKQIHKTTSSVEEKSLTEA